MTPKNSDIGGYHIAFYVDDIKAAKDYLDSKGVKRFFGPFPVEEGPAAGQAITYFVAPWGLQMEIISYPKGMAYEKTSPIKLWSHPTRRSNPNFGLSRAFQPRARKDPRFSFC